LIDVEANQGRGFGAALRPPMGPGGEAPGSWGVFSISDTEFGVSRKGDLHKKII
jgi:hypothetical protein